MVSRMIFVLFVTNGPESVPDQYSTQMADIPTIIIFHLFFIIIKVYLETP